MSNRYVWSRYNIEAASEAQYSGDWSGGLTTPTACVLGDDVTWSYTERGSGLSRTIYSSVPLYAYAGKGYTIANGKFVITNTPILTQIATSDRLNPSDSRGKQIYNATDDSYDVYIGISTQNLNEYDVIYRVNGTVQDEQGSQSIYLYTQKETNSSPIITQIRLYGYAYNATGSWAGHRLTRARGSAAGTASNASSSTYPQDGVSGNYWYELQGSDNIDAASVGYSNQAPMGGQPITINVTPGSGKVYGGTVRYTYQVQLNGGAWTTIATNSTATSQQYTIPAGTTSFAARVLASDDLGFSSSDYTTGATLTVTNNLPPTAPASITIGDVLGGQACTITWEAATDSDGTIASYQLERQTDNGDTWTQIYSGLALTYDDTINSEWATVNYRVRAVDDDGDAGPYATGTMKTVNDGWLYFSGPAADMGDKPAPFDFIFAIGSTTGGITDINVEVVLDDVSVYTGTPDAAEQVTIPVDTRLMYEGEHTFVITAEKENLLGLTQVCAFTVPALTLPDGGAMVQLYNDEGRAVFPLTLGRAVIGQNSESVNRQLDRYFSGTYTGTGTSGSGNPTQLRLSFTPRFLSVYSNASTPATGLWIRTADVGTQAQGVMQTTGGTATVQWDAENMILSWYGSSAAVQLNASGVEYGYVVTG